MKPYTTLAFYAGIGILGGLPLITSLLDLEPETQSNIRAGSWMLAALVATAGAIREEDKGLFERRTLADGVTNSNFMLRRQENMNLTTINSCESTWATK